MNKRLKLIIIMIIIMLVGVAVYISYEKISYNNKIENLNNLLKNNEYNEFLIGLKDIKEDYELQKYKNVVEDFLKLRSNEDIDIFKEEIDSFNKKYSEILNDDKLINLKNEYNEIRKKLEEYYSSLNQDKEKIIKAIEEDIDSVEEMINSFKEKYANEDISDIENTYRDKLEEIKKLRIEEEKKAENERLLAEKAKEEKNNNITQTNNEDQQNQQITSVDNESSSNNNTVSKSIANTSTAQNSSQIVTVISEGGSYGEVVAWEKTSDGLWREVQRVKARLGANGLKDASLVYEMDKCTPTGIYTLTEAFGIYGDPGSGLPYRKLDGTEYWVDDENSDYYNTMQFGEPNGRWNSAEKLIDYPGYYNYSIVIDYNRSPVIKGKSSAIFLHCSMDIYTYGCVAIPQSNLVNMLKWLEPSKNPVIILDFSYEDIYSKY